MKEFACSLPTDEPEALAALAGVSTIAVVGLSPNPTRDSFMVATYLQKKGYRIIPIRPGIDAVLGEKAYPNLVDYGQPVDMVDIFRKPEAVPEIVDQAIALGAKVIWMQEGIGHAQAADKAKAAGLRVVENLCVRKVLQHQEK
jgi:uncharacterized protein